MNFPNLLELNLGRTDFRVRMTDKDISYSVFNKLFTNLPTEIKNIGIGGQPLRYKWWKKLICLLSKNTKQTIYIVDEIKNINIQKLEYIAKFENIHLYIIFNWNLTVPMINNLKNKIAGILIPSNIENISAIKKILEREKVIFSIEMVSWLAIKLETKHCMIAKHKILACDLDGNIYPCIALINTKNSLGNLFVNNFKDIMVNYNNYTKKPKYEMCNTVWSN